MARIHSLKSLKQKGKRRKAAVPKKSGVYTLADFNKNKSGKVGAKAKKDEDGDYQTSDEEESEEELKDDGIEEVDEVLGEGQWEELDENGNVIVVGAPDAVPPTDGMTEEGVADTIMKGDERFAVLTRRHRIAFGNVIAKYDFIAKNTAAADQELDFSDVKSGEAKGDRHECLYGTHYVKRTKGRERWVLIPEVERSRLDKELKAKGIKCVCAVYVEREKNSFAIRKNIAGETRSGKKIGADAKWREMGEGHVLGTN